MPVDSILRWCWSQRNLWCVMLPFAHYVAVVKGAGIIRCIDMRWNHTLASVILVLLPPPMGYVFALVCSPICLSVCQQDCSRSYGWLCVKLLEGVWHGDFGYNGDRGSKYVVESAIFGIADLDLSIHYATNFYGATMMIKGSLLLSAPIFFKIQFWYLSCCGCPWNRGRQHLATPLKTCHNTEAGFLQGGCSAYPPTQKWRHLRLRRSRTWAVCLPLSPQKGDHPPSHDDNFARTSVCRWLPQKPTYYFITAVL